MDIALSRSKAVRKPLLHQVQDKISQSDFFKIKEEPVVWDEYHYIELLIWYLQHFNQAPCLRPLIKLELVETDLLEPFESRKEISLSTIDYLLTITLITTKFIKILQSFFFELELVTHLKIPLLWYSSSSIGMVKLLFRRQSKNPKFWST